MTCKDFCQVFNSSSILQSFSRAGLRVGFGRLLWVGWSCRKSLAGQTTCKVYIPLEHIYSGSLVYVFKSLGNQ